jgi:hypothetical protein
MSDDHSKPVPDLVPCEQPETLSEKIPAKPVSNPEPYERPETLSEKIPALWALIGLILSFIAVAVHPMILRYWEPRPPTEPQERVLRSAPPETRHP